MGNLVPSLHQSSGKSKTLKQILPKHLRGLFIISEEYKKEISVQKRKENKRTSCNLWLKLYGNPKHKSDKQLEAVTIMALLFLEEDPWIIEHESCEKLQREIMGQLTERQKFSRTSSKYAQISADIRLRLKQFNNEVEQLKQKLDILTANNSITAAESERRIRQIEVLITKATQMQNLFDEQLSMKRMEERIDLLGSKGTDWDEYGSGPSALSVQDMRVKQKEMLNEQEKGLENLSKIISRQKDIANTISNEVDYHNEILDDIDSQMDRTDQRVRTETDRVVEVDKKDNTCGYWIVIIILFISIVVVAAI